MTLNIMKLALNVIESVFIFLIQQLKMNTTPLNSVRVRI